MFFCAIIQQGNLDICISSFIYYARGVPNLPKLTHKVGSAGDAIILTI